MFIFLCYIILSPIIFGFIIFSSIFNAKIRSHLLDARKSVRLAKSKIDLSAKDKKIILFHAASAGEYEQLKPILKEIDSAKYFVLLTFFSPTIFKKEKYSQLADAVCYHPFDLPWSAILFFIRLKPQKYIITRHDIWPFHLYFARLMGIQTIFINANLYLNSSRFNFGLTSFNRWVFHQFDLILTGSETLKNTILSLAPKSTVKITGDSRFDQVIQRSRNSRRDLLPSIFESSKNIILGSMVSSDLPILSQTFDALGNFFFGADIRLIIVPHEVGDSNLLQLEKLLLEKDLSYKRITEFKEFDSPQVLIVNKVGILADLYASAKIAYIGAGFSSGVHSVIEPAVHKCAVVYGPRVDILDEAVEMTQIGAGLMIHNGIELAEFFQKISHLPEIERLGNRAYEFIIEKEYASTRIINEIFS
jgi:3-deoxy-D-manno-octulosonic-acid transferase